jgi:hypothetical protein
VDDISMLDSDGRRSRMVAMWRKDHDEIAVVYDHDGPAWKELFRYAPGMADRVRWAEQDAEEASLDWVAKGVGEIQTAINLWRDLWIDAINLVRDSRWN